MFVMSSIMQRSSKGSSERELKFMMPLYETTTNPHAPNNVTVNIYWKITYTIFHHVLVILLCGSFCVQVSVVHTLLILCTLDMVMMKETTRMIMQSNRKLIAEWHG